MKGSGYRLAQLWRNGIANQSRDRLDNDRFIIAGEAVGFWERLENRSLSQRDAPILLRVPKTAIAVSVA